MFDIGVNLTSPQFSRDRDEVVARAQAAGVTGMLFTGTNLHESEQARQLAHRYTRCWSTAGVQPQLFYSSGARGRLQRTAGAGSRAVYAGFFALPRCP